MQLRFRNYYTIFYVYGCGDFSFIAAKYPRKNESIIDINNDPPCSPHTPIFISGLVARPPSTPRRTMAPTPSESMDSKGKVPKMPSVM